MEIKNWKKVADRPSYVKILLYGKGGTRKTTFCAEAPNPFWEDSENSTETLKHYPEYADIPVKTPEGPAEMLEDVKKAIKDPEIETFVIDSLTSILYRFVNTTKGKYRDNRMLYGEATDRFAEILELLVNAPINVAIICHRRVDREPETHKILGIYPDVTPRLQDVVTRLVNVVGYMEIEPSQFEGKEVQKLYLNPTPLIEAKNRLRISKTFIENPNWKDLFNV